jgi:hypothetical protein
MELKLKAAFSLRTKQFCQGCGDCLTVECILEPMLANKQYESYLLDSIREALYKITNSACPTCHKKTKQVNYYRERD